MEAGIKRELEEERRSRSLGMATWPWIALFKLSLWELGKCTGIRNYDHFSITPNIPCHNSRLGCGRRRSQPHFKLRYLWIHNSTSHPRPIQFQPKTIFISMFQCPINILEGGKIFQSQLSRWKLISRKLLSSPIDGPNIGRNSRKKALIFTNAHLFYIQS